MALPRTDSGGPLVSARDASYWLTVASTPSSSRSGDYSSASASFSSRSLDANSFLLNLRNNNSSFLDGSNPSFVDTHVPTSPSQHDNLDTSTSFSSLYASAIHASQTTGYNTPPNFYSGCRSESKRPLIVAEEVYEHQRYHLLLGWGSKGHLLPLDPDKYMRVVRHSKLRRKRHPQSTEATQDDAEMLLEWSPSSTFPDIALPEPLAIDRVTVNTRKQRSRSATTASGTSRHAATTSSACMGSRWAWVSPWHLEIPPDNPRDAVDGWQFASSFSNFRPRPLHRFRGRSIDSMSQSMSPVCRELPSSSRTSSGGKRFRVRRRKWVRYRRVHLNPRNRSVGPSFNAFDDAFLDSMSGWLRKRGHVRKNWKERYFVLEKSVLRYYTDSCCTKLKGEVLLFHPHARVHYVDVHVAGGRDASFAIQIGPEYTLLLQAPQLRDRENWMYCIEDALLCRNSYHPQRGACDGPGVYVDLRESVARRRLLSAEAMALDGRSWRDNLGGISHAHGNAFADVLTDEEDGDVDTSEHSLLQRTRGRTSSTGSDVLRLWASLHAKPGGVLSAVSSASMAMRSLLRECDHFLASGTMRQHISSFLVHFRQKYERRATSSVTAMGASAWMRLSEPWAPGTSSYESDSYHEVREGSLEALPQVTALQDARSLLALKNYRFFLERSLELIMEHLCAVAGASALVGDATLNSEFAVSEDEWALVRRAALYKLERRAFIALQEIIYQLLGAGLGSTRSQWQEEEERFERLRAQVASYPQNFLEIQLSHQSTSEWKIAVAVLNTMDNYSLPSEKAAVLVEVARCIYETHSREHDVSINSSMQPTPMAADDFLPIFIFVLARCQLRSVIVARHLISETMITALMIGETGYYATMLEAAIGYIASFDGAAKAGEIESRNSTSGSTILITS
ncbi:hypothetical protein CCR75_009124 [Bremia lactucae]|uniref:VPS9 domain-containing protein n=1 Tax=Bremia lactucae TaxID=4779 RepID=A0A976FMN0_BRELC|nr:hypothetical protein CCR75_009124 [Bremia lactucae]